jgi:hypothetical protein
MLIKDGKGFPDVEDPYEREEEEFEITKNMRKSYIHNAIDISLVLSCI